MAQRLPANNSDVAEKQHLGRYGLVSTLGQGGMGTIHLAVAGGLGEFQKLLVVKELRRDLAQNDKFVAMFLAEAKLAARLSHPNVVQTLEAGMDGDRYFLSMEFLDGQPFIELLRRALSAPVVPLSVRIQILCEVLAGLHYAHELRDYDGTPLEIVHRDVSPANVFVTYDGQVKVVDFGIAKAADAEHLTSPGVFKGKFPYAAPEQVTGQPVDRRTDVFAVGVMLWEAVCLRRFAPGVPTQASIAARVRGSEPRLASVVPDVDPWLAQICDRATHIDPDARFASAEEFRAVLQRFVLMSGEIPSAAAIAEVMHGKFAAEHAIMHRLIDAHIKDADLSVSMIRDLHPAWAREPIDDSLTAVADLSELIESSRVDNPVLAAASLVAAPTLTRARSTQRVSSWAYLLVLAALVMLALVCLQRMAALRAALLPSRPALHTTAPRVSAPPPAVAATPAEAPVTPPAEVLRLPDDVAAPRARVTRQRPQPSAAHGSERPRRRTASDQTQVRAAAERSPEPAETRPAPSEMGDDLRQLRHPSQHALDVKDPFR
jgi:eukaryotic-like serine/threonine-protein kinase